MTKNAILTKVNYVILWRYKKELENDLGKIYRLTDKGK